MDPRPLISAAVTGLLPTALLTAQEAAPGGQRPNIVLIMCDDMGFSDLGCYGGEAETPNIDTLAMQGVRFSHFRNTARSCPSRAALLTGLYQHDAGMGWMTAVDEHRPGYRGELAPDVPTVAEVLRASGYRTCMSGKWHLTLDADFGSPDGSYPAQRGFDRYYGSLSGGGSYWTPSYLYNDLEPVSGVPDGYYYTDAVTDSAEVFVRRHQDGSPLFLYVAYYAPHLPLQAPEDRVEKCRKRFECGYDVLRKERFERQKAMGFFPVNDTLPVFSAEFGGSRPEWEELPENDRRRWTEGMATYTAMIEIVDDGVGRIVRALKDKGMFDNTVFMFLSDNGSTSEGGLMKQLMADLSNTPYRNYKQWCHEGGISSPFIFTWGDPERNPLAGQICRQDAHIIDIMPTCLDLASVAYPGNGRGIRLPGKSVLPAASGAGSVRRIHFFEHQSSCAVVEGKWKLVRRDMGCGWELYDLSSDPYETDDLAERKAAVAARLRKKWDKWAERHNVLPLENLPWSERIRHYSDAD